MYNQVSVAKGIEIILVLLTRYSNLLLVISFIVCTLYAVYKPLYFSSDPWAIDRLDYIIPSILGYLMVYYISLKWMVNLRLFIYRFSYSYYLRITFFGI